MLPADVLASPGTIARAGGELIGDGGTLPHAMGVSLRRVAVGLLLGGAVGIALALVSGLSRLGEDLVDAPVQMLRTVPGSASSRCSSSGWGSGRPRRWPSSPWASPSTSI